MRWIELDAFKIGLDDGDLSFSQLAAKRQRNGFAVRKRGAANGAEMLLSKIAGDIHFGFGFSVCWERDCGLRGRAWRGRFDG